MEDIYQKELEKIQGEIRKDLDRLLEHYIKIFDWDIPENDELKTKELILKVMEDELQKLKKSKGV
ncbi:MAG: hypothetical protein GXO02_01460 [Epsilonproteobacteria bacterium]|nr:hypothetical protein [Campylobacterota bacterium]